jgi:hypothetical protein
MPVALETMTVKHFSNKCDSRRIVSQDNLPSRITGWKLQTFTAGFKRRGFPKFQPNITRIPMGLLLDVFKTCQGLKKFRDGHFGTDVVQDTYRGGIPFESWLGYRLSSYLLRLCQLFLTDFGILPWLRLCQHTYKTLLVYYSQASCRNIIDCIKCSDKTS